MEESCLASLRHDTDIAIKQTSIIRNKLKDLVLTYGEEFVETLGGFLYKGVPAPVVVVFPRQSHDAHPINQGICTNYIVPLLRVVLMHVDTPGSFTSSWETDYHNHLKTK